MADRMVDVRSTTDRRRRGFSVRELIVVVLILSVAVFVLAAWGLRRREDARQMRCEQRLIELAKAVHYHDQLHGGFPGFRNLQAVASNELPVATGWAFPLLPYLEFDPDTDQVGPFADVYEKFGPEAEPRFRGKTPPLYLPNLVCPAVVRENIDRRTPHGDFVANTGLPDVPLPEMPPVGIPPDQPGEGESDEPLPPDWPANGVLQDHFLTNLAAAPRMSLEFLEKHDGAEHTWLFSENVDAGRWTDAQEARVGFVWVPGLQDGQATRGEELLDINQRRGEGNGNGNREIRFARPSSFHAAAEGGANVVFCSGRTQFLTQTIDYLLFTQLMTSNGQQLRIPGTKRPIPPPYSPKE